MLQDHSSLVNICQVSSWNWYEDNAQQTGRDLCFKVSVLPDCPPGQWSVILDSAWFEDSLILPMKVGGRDVITNDPLSVFCASQAYSLWDTSR